MVDPGESVSVTVRREFTEEAGNLTDPLKKQMFEQMTDQLFKSGEMVYRGYVDDPRKCACFRGHASHGRHLTREALCLQHRHHRMRLRLCL